MKNIILLIISIAFSVCVLEIFLNFYNPFSPRVRGNQIILPRNKTIQISNDRLSKLPKEILHTKNNLGFRGPNPESDNSSQLSIICVGGSTTECYYLGDGQDWPNQLLKRMKPMIPDIWINNAGLDGHSTWGHLMLLNQHIFELKPDFILMLCGINDLGRKDISEYDTKQVHQETVHVNSIRDWIIEHSQILSTIRAVRMSLNAIKHGVYHTDLNLKECEIMVLEEQKIDSAIQSHLPMIHSYGRRLETIIQECKKHNIRLILMTQPMLWGDIIDPGTGISLNTIKLNKNMNSKMRWVLMNEYNKKMIEVGHNNNVPVIDLANKLEKNIGYFYDEIHFTPQGSEKISEIIIPHIMQIINEKE
jgi:lysophospholipase L1-like esterase